jgi:DNA polymerase-3 subunit gamma/tau
MAAAPPQRTPAPEPDPEPAPAPRAVSPSPPAPAALLVTDTEHWLDLVARSSLRGPVRLLAEHAAFVAHADGVLRLALTPDDEHLKSPSLVLQLGDALAAMLGGAVQLRFETGEPRGDTARARNARERDARQAQAEQGFVADPGVQRLVQAHGARILPDSIRPLGDN